MKRAISLVVLLWATGAQAVPVSWGLNAFGNGGFSPVTHTYSGSNVGSTETIPTGATQVIIEACGPGGSGGSATGAVNVGGAGGSGAYSKKTLSLSSGDWGKTFTLSTFVGGAGALNAAGNSSSATTVVNSTYGTSVSITANAGGAGAISPTFIGGAGGTATGGDVNTAGNVGDTGGNIGGGVTSGGTSIIGTHCSSGAGSDGAKATTTSNGGVGAAAFSYT